MTSRPLRNKARCRVLRLEPLEARDAPATLVSATKVTYQDVDGDDVTVVFSKPILNAGSVDNIFGAGFVTGSNDTPQQLRVIDLAGLGAATAGVSITTVATRSNIHGGDGFAAVGHINAPRRDVGTVSIDGDLGRILAGDFDAKTPGLKALRVQSLGRYGVSTGAPDLITEIGGRLGSLLIKSDLNEAIVLADGDIGSITIGGSLLGGATDLFGQIAAAGDIGVVNIRGDIAGGSGYQSGSIVAERAIGTVVIGGSLRGGAGSSSGRIHPIGGIGALKINGDVAGGSGVESGFIVAEQAIGAVTIGGSVRGGAGIGSGQINLLRSGPVKIAGSVVGGDGPYSGQLYSTQALPGVMIGGSVRGGAGISSGQVGFAGATGAVTVTGDVAGGSGAYSGMLGSNGPAASIIIGGSVLGGTNSNSGQVFATGAVGALRIAGDVVGGSAAGAMDLSQSGYIQAQRIANLTLGGSLIAGTDDTSGLFEKNGSIRVTDDLGRVVIKGSVIGNATNPAIISARGSGVPTATSDLAVASLTVLGRVEYAQILAGVLPSGTAANADAQVGPVTVGGDWIASSIAAGVAPGPDGYFGNADDVKFTGVMKDVVGVSSRIVSLTIAGQALGTLSSPRDAYGVVAENVSAVKIGGTPLVLNANQSFDDFALGISGDFRVHEV